MFEAGLLKRCLKPKVGCDLPGRLRLCFPRYSMLPEKAVPYLHYVQDVLMMLEGMTRVEINPRIGTVLVLYDAHTLSSGDILHWVDVVIDTGVQLAKETERNGIRDEQKLEFLMRRRLNLRLPKGKKG